MHLLFLPSSDVMNEVIITSPKPCLFPAATDISYVVYGVRLFISYLLSLSVVVFRIREFSFFSLIQNLVRSPSPVFSGSSQVILTLLDLMLVTVGFLGLSGNRATKGGNHDTIILSLYYFFRRKFQERSKDNTSLTFQ